MANPKDNESAPSSDGASPRFHPNDKRTGSLIVKCARDGCPYSTKRSPSTLKLAGGKAFCTQECYRIVNKGKKRNYPKRARTAEYVTKSCSFCGKPVERRVTDSRPRHYCNMSCAAKMPKGGGRPAKGRTIGTKHVNTHGYVDVYVGPDHPMANKRGYTGEHRLVMMEKIGRPLLANETPHHVNLNRQDNRPENLELWASSQPKGARASDLLAHAREIIALYEPIEAKL